MPEFTVIRDTDALDWNCREGHSFTYTYLEMKRNGISCPHCKID